MDISSLEMTRKKYNTILSSKRNNVERLRDKSQNVLSLSNTNINKRKGLAERVSLRGQMLMRNPEQAHEKALEHNKSKIGEKIK